MHAVLPLLALAQALGILAAEAGGLASQTALAIGIEAWLAGCLLARRPGPRLACAALVCFSAGGATLALRLEAAAQIPLQRRLDADIEATVAASARAAASVSLELRAVVAVSRDAPAFPARVLVSEERGSAESAWLLARSRGERVRLRVRARPADGLRNPGRAAASRALMRRGIGARASLVDAALTARISERDAPFTGAWRSVDRLRQRLRHRLAAAPLPRALVLGDRGELAPAETAAVTRLGLSHLLAVSGLHLALTAGFVYAVARALQRLLPPTAAAVDRRRRALLAAAFAATGYALLTGAGIPVQRALFFLWAAVAGGAFARPIPASHVLVLAAMGILAFDPACLFELGPQLSFAATAALVFARAPAGSGEAPRSGARRGLEGLRSLLAASCAAVAATAPILANHGLASSAAGLFANVVAIPWTACALMPASLLAAAAAALPPQAAGDAVIEAAGWLAARSLAAAVAIAGSLPSLPPQAQPSAWATALATGLALAALRSRSTTWRLVLSLCVSVGLRVAPVPELRPLPPRLVSLDVGQGDALLVQGRRAAMLVDAGRAWPGGSDMGRSVVLPALAALGIRRLALVVASHADLDHAGGLTAVIEGFAVDELWLPAGAADDARFRGLRERAAARGVPVRAIDHGAAPRRFGDLEVTVLWPPPAGPGEAGEAGNEGSLVLRVEIENRSLLLVGDLGLRSEARLLAQPARLRADVLKVGHHGSAGSSGAPFLAAVAPSVALVSASCGGRMNLPAAETLARLRAAGAVAWWTGRDGAVVVGLDAAALSPVVASVAESRNCVP